MDFQYLLILTILFTFLLMLLQRTESGKRTIVIVSMIIPVILIRNFIIIREVQTEGWIALFLGLFLNFMFWILIGRYNPVRSSDEIQVLGLDD